MRRALVALLVCGPVVGLLGIAVVGSATATLGHDAPSPFGGDLGHPAGDVDPLPKCGDDLSRLALDDPGRHRNGRVGQRAIELRRESGRGTHGRGPRGGCSSNPTPSPPTTSRCHPAGPAPPTPYDPTDTVRGGPTSVRRGAAGGADLSACVYAYNHSASYVAAGPCARPPTPPSSTDRQAAVRRRLRNPEGAGSAPSGGPFSRLARPTSGAAGGRGGFNFYGLVQAAYAVAGVSLPAWPRTSSTPRQSWHPALAGTGRSRLLRRRPGFHRPRRPLRGCGERTNVMVDAPHAGADVRADPFPATPGASFGSLLYVAATRPNDGQRLHVPHVVGRV